MLGAVDMMRHAETKPVGLPGRRAAAIYAAAGFRLTPNPSLLYCTIEVNSNALPRAHVTGGV
jgi:hypothetical protein